MLRASRGISEPASARARRSGHALPPGFDAWFMKATAVDPLARFDRAEPMVAALGVALGISAPVPSAPYASRPSFPGPDTTAVHPSAGFAHATEAKPRSSSVAPVIALALALAALVGVVEVWLSLTPGDPPSTSGARPSAPTTAPSVTAAAPAIGATPSVEVVAAPSASASAPAPSASATIGPRAKGPPARTPAPPTTRPTANPRGEGLF
jgi:serine/threonine-protein kinase